MDSMAYVRQQLAAPDLNLRVVADASGVGYSWLKMFARGEIPDPGYHKVKQLADYFLSLPPLVMPTLPRHDGAGVVSGE